MPPREEEAREIERQLRALSDNLPSGLVYQVDTGADGRQRQVTYMSGGVLQLHALTADEMIADSTRLYSQIHPEDRQLVAQLEAIAIEAMRPFDVEVRVVLPSGETKWRHFASAPRRLPNGHLIWDGIEIDITRRKQMEDEANKLQEQLLQARKMESVGRLAGGVAHDFNNMLCAILGHAELALQQVDPRGPLFSHIQEIRTAAERSAQLTRQLLAFARKQTAMPRPIDINDTVDSALKSVRKASLASTCSSP